MKINKLLILFACLLSMSAIAYAEELDALGNPIIRSIEKCSTSTEAKQLQCVSYHQTTGYTCGPASAMTLMRYYGKLNAGQMNSKTELRIASEMGTTTTGTTMSQVAGWLSGQGMNVSSGQNISADELIANIKRGTPVIIGFGDHWIVAKGYRKGNASTYNHEDEFTFADSCCGVTTIPRGVIDSVGTPNLYPKQCTNINYIVATR